MGFNVPKLHSRPTPQLIERGAIELIAQTDPNDPGGLTERTVRKIMTLQGVLQPHQIISLFDIGGATLAMGDHADHIHVGFSPGGTVNGKGRVATGERGKSVLSKKDWHRVFDHLGKIENPEVPSQPSAYAIKVPKKSAKKGD